MSVNHSLAYRFFVRIVFVAAVAFFIGVVDAKAQYLETFSTPNKGRLLGCVNDFSGVNWTISVWDAAGTCQLGDNRDPTDFFNTTAAGRLESIDLDEQVYWESPLINIATPGTVTLGMDLTWVGFDSDVMANTLLTDWIKVQYSVNGGAYTTVPNVVGGHPGPATIAYPFQNPGGSFDGSTTINVTGISGTTMRIRVVTFTNANAELVTMDNVSVPQNGVFIVPTAAGVSISGRVLTADGRGVRNARVTILNRQGIARNVATGPYGYYRFDDVETGQSYVARVVSRRFGFEPQVLQVNDNLTDVDFVAGTSRRIETMTRKR
ncbi:MAG: carboxypeptidase-like regulatory domain-containing protein [Pyrinomonadaceae bacterium]